VDGMLRPFPADRMEAYPVSLRVNDPKHENPSCVEPVAV
jgi:putative SOS response-associated peptidase YedK